MGNLKDHILDQKRRYQSVVLSHEQADMVLKLIDGAVEQAIELAERRVIAKRQMPTFDYANQAPLCQNCGQSTKYEMANVGDRIWCHPCADAASMVTSQSGKTP